MTSFTIPPQEIDILDANELLSSYRFDDGIAKHYFCSRCGIFTFVATRLNPGEYRVNLGCIEDLDSFDVPVTVFNGKDI